MTEHGTPLSRKTDPRAERQETVRTWLWVAAFTAGTLLWGLLLFFFVGDKGPSPWDFSVIEDLPGGSPYSTYGPQQFPGTSPHPAVAGPEVDPQHVRNRPGAGELQP
ncbi:MAG: hypothetical protein HY900_11470 [Deltaproteobacteria bacterium]|nr:hypothetical protein [Deltaproteobacteria bacterium]